MTAPKAEVVNVVQDTDLISHRAEIFRSKLIEDFHLLDSISEKGRLEVPKYYSKDVQDEELLDVIMKTGPHGLVRFQVYSAKDKIILSVNDRRKTRVKNKNCKYPPLELWAHWVVETSWFQNSILFLILSNCIVLGIQAELKETIGDPTVDTVKLILEIFDYSTLYVFVLEILLKFVDDFWNFWKNFWNIFDFFVTFLSLIPEFIALSSGQFGNYMATSQLIILAENFRVFRILRSLKMVTRFRQVRLIALAVAKAFRAMVFITLLLFTLIYIFAIAGVILFDRYSHSNRMDLVYKSSFESMYSAVITLFQLLTLDHWNDILEDVSKESDPAFSGIYIILWICIGSFIFRNIFVGIMVNNFQSIRNELFNEVKEMEDLREQTHKMEKFSEELQRQGLRRSSFTSETMLEGYDGQIQYPADQPHWDGSSGLQGDKSPPADLAQDSLSRVSSVAELKRALSLHVTQESEDSKDWQQTVEENLETVAKNPVISMWPRDSLFQYFLLMEALQENLKERSELILLASEALLKVHDT